MVELRIKTRARVEVVDITERVNQALAESEIESGLCNLFVLHTTAALVVSENADPDVTSDLVRQLQKLVPREAGYKHAEGNSQAHILSVMLGTSLNLPVVHARLRLGRWQGVMLVELDGPRERILTLTTVAAR